MNNNYDVERIAKFKQWIRNRFLSEVDVKKMSPQDAIAWSIALIEVGQEILKVAFIWSSFNQIIPFKRDRHE